MSSVGSSSQNRSSIQSAGEAMKQMQETFNEREVNESKKHREELQTVTAEHRAEVQKLADTNERRFRDLKERSDDALSKQDMAYQKEIKELREMYQKQIERNAQNVAKERSGNKEGES